MNIFLLCLKIFLARICDVSIGTVRMILTVKGKKIYATLSAFLEVFIWFMIAKEALSTEIDSIFIPLSYASGYATGTLMGMIISDKFIDSIVGVQVISNNITKEMIDEIRKKGFAVTIIPIKKEEKREEKEMLYIQLHKSKLKFLTKILNGLDKKAFIIVSETKTIQNGFIK